ncbi:unnamed protein product [Cyprideis torosa]|uniref:Vacuolar fusion protein MON1 homolog n=1 Tax=Cyprideis torosa TaxID=163714 RepID=A0A7R8ZJC1_9CRUS|nr:unnamed protein product [Cyprideis torosa]CAG0881953.1 unnamed protein product [Cyprideis torosa]
MFAGMVLKADISEKPRLRSQGILTSVNHALAAAPLTVHSIGPAVSNHLRHFIYKCRALAMFTEPDIHASVYVSEHFQKAVENVRLRSQGILTSVNHALAAAPLTVHSIGPAVSNHLRHFIYKCRALAMFTEPDIHASVYVSEQEHLMSLYWSLHQRLHRISHPQVKLAFFVGQRELALGWMTERFEMYATFEPMSTKRQAINSINALLKWLKTEEEKLFIMNGPTF